MIKFENVTVNYDNTFALNNINLNIKTNDTTILIGPSGCGKSTLLRVVTGLIKNNNKNSGSVYINDSLLCDNTITTLRQRMGYVIQQGGLFPHLTVRDNVTLMASQLSWSKLKIENRLQQLTELVRLTPEFYNRYPSELSGGQQQRVSLMRALMLDPDLLLLDEPLGALDPMIRFDLQQELKDIFNDLNKTVIMVTHDIAEAAYFADHIVLMRQGEIIQQGLLSDLAQHPSEPFVEHFIRAQRKPLTFLEQALS